MSYMETKTFTREHLSTVVLPKRYQRQVIRLAHDIPFAGHFGREKTARRILQRFYWPTLFQDVRLYCKTCKECQLHGGRGGRAPLIPLPIIGKPLNASLWIL